jgi:flagellar operon protein (TIGR03826 family)
MTVKNCRTCGRLFNYITGQQICPACKEELEKKFTEVKEFIKNTRNATIQMVAENCDVEESQVKQWVREERLVFSDASFAGVACENCGTPITTGRFCDKCKVQMMNDFGSMIKKPEAPQPKKQKESPRMRFIDNR